MPACLESLPVAAHAVARSRHVGRLGDHRDAAVTERDQVIDESARPGDAVAFDQVAVVARDRPVEEHEGQPVLLERAQLRRGAVAHGRDQDALDAEGEQVVEVAVLALEVALAVTEDHVPAVAPGDVLGAAHDQGEERVSDVGDDHPDRLAADDAPRDVSELGDRRLDPAPRLVADPGLAVDHARHRHRRDAGEPGNVANRRLHRVTVT